MFHHFFSQKLYDSLILATVQIIKTAGKCSYSSLGEASGDLKLSLC